MKMPLSVAHPIRQIWLLIVFASNCLAIDSGDATLEFVGLLAKKHSYLFSKEDSKKLDLTNRRLRELLEPGGSHARLRPTAEAVADEMSGLTEQVTALLADCRSVIQVEVGPYQAIPQTSGPTMLAGDFGALILRIVRPGSGHSFTSLELNLSEQEFTMPEVELPADGSGTNWILLSLTNVPRAHSTLLFVVRSGEVRVPLYLEVATPRRGHLRVTVLSDDTGKPTPAMIRLVNPLNGAERKPANAVDFEPQFDGQGKPTGRRPANYFGRLRGSYWCVPGPFDMVLPEGEWEITIQRGPEHLPIVETVSIIPDEVTERTFRPRRWVDMRNLGWYSGDDHVHARILSDDDAARVMAWVKAEDIHIANIAKMGDAFRTWFEQRGWGKEYRVRDGDHILSPGQEDPRTHAQLGHTLHMNTTTMVRDIDQYYLYDQTFDTVHSQGGLSGYAHVLDDMFFVHRDMSLNIPKGKVDFVEIMQFGRLGTDLFYQFLNAGFKMTASAGSDVPWGGTVGEVRVYAQIGPQPFTADAWFESVRKGHTFVSNGPMLQFTVDGVLPGDEVRPTNDRKLHVWAKAWGHQDRVTPTALEVVLHGEVIRRIERLPGSDSELSLDFEIDSKEGFWIAARAEGSQGERAHTSPVYVVKNGLRFWKFEEALSLIETMEGYLDEIELIVAEAPSVAGETKPPRPPRRLLAQQGTTLMNRVESARVIFKELRTEWERERLLRSPEANRIRQ